MDNELKEFAVWCITQALQGGDIDGGELQDKAQALGLIRQTFYDPEVHGPNDADVVEGDMWFVLAPELRAAPSPSSDTEGGE